MKLPVRARRVLLAVHLATAVGWIGAVAAFLALALVGLSTPDGQLVRGVYVAMAGIAWWVIVPACGAAALSGSAQALGSPWGVARHYWIAFKLLLTLVAAVALAVHMQPTGQLADAARAGPIAPDALVAMRRQLVIAPAAAIVLLLINVGLGVIKPAGVTPWGVRARRDRRQPPPAGD
jgi:hypothetical protein